MSVRSISTKVDILPQKSFKKFQKPLDNRQIYGIMVSERGKENPPNREGRKKMAMLIEIIIGLAIAIGVMRYSNKVMDEMKNKD